MKAPKSARRKRKLEGHAPNSKLTKEREDLIVDLLVKGNYIETAAAYAGIDSSTLHRWLRRGKRERERLDKGEEPQLKEVRYVRFSRSVEKAFAEAEMADVNHVVKAGKNDWKAAAWRLERKWGKRQSLHTEDEESELKIELLKKELEMKEHELRNLRGESEQDAHQQGNSYEDALNKQARVVFIEEMEADEHGEETEKDQ